MNNISLYIHFPWCIKKCPYCDFNSYKYIDPNLNNIYIEKLKEEILQKTELFNNKIINTIFMGGGTPSLFSACQLKELLIFIKNNFSISNNCEISIEINPGSKEYSSVNEYINVGINRFSVGVQSFNDHMLKKLGRIHNSEQASKLLDELNKKELNFNIDLMYGLPGQNIDMARSDLEKSLSFSPKHLSWYQLTIEPNTIFYKYKPNGLPKHDYLADIMNMGQELISQKLNQYEISAYSKTNYICKHNYNYWEFGDYIGIGSGAHSKYTINKNIYRSYNTRAPKDYLNSNNPNVSTNKIKENEVILEFLMNSLRLKDGVDLSVFKKRTFKSINDLLKTIKISEVQELILVTENKILPSKKGLDFLDHCLAKIAV